MYSFMLLYEKEEKIKQKPKCLDGKKKEKERLEIGRKEKLNKARI